MKADIVAKLEFPLRVGNGAPGNRELRPEVKMLILIDQPLIDMGQQ